MADSTIDSERIFLIDNWPGTALPTYGAPTDGFTGSGHHNVATAIYKVGTKIQVYNDSATAGQDGFSTFIYLQYEGTGAPTSAAKQVVVPDAVGTGIYVVTNDPDSCVSNTGFGMAAVAISAMTDAYYGWFWCGGVCPEAYVSGLGGNYATTNAVAVASGVIAENLSADAIGFGVQDAAGDVTFAVCLADDA